MGGPKQQCVISADAGTTKNANRLKTKYIMQSTLRKDKLVCTGCASIALEWVNL